nr:alpha/beta fold hydrolase [Nocardia jejuensis]
MLSISMSGTASADYRVDYNFFAGIPFELTNPGGSLPGSNDWSCKPSAAHPDPVVLLHGTAGSRQTNWGLYAPLLANEGYCVYALTYGQLDVPWPLSELAGMRTIQSSAAEVATFVDRVLASTGAAKVDLVGHSQGNVVGQYFVKRLGGADVVNRFVGIAAPWEGTYADQMSVIRTMGKALGVQNVDPLLSLGVCQACGQMLGGGEFMTALTADGVYAPNVTYTGIGTVYDELVVPVTIGLVPAPNATNFLMQDGCPIDFSDHLGIAGSPRVAAIVLNALDPDHQRPVPCQFVAPFTG